MYRSKLESRSRENGQDFYLCIQQRWMGHTLDGDRVRQVTFTNVHNRRKKEHTMGERRRRNSSDLYSSVASNHHLGVPWKVQRAGIPGQRAAIARVPCTVWDSVCSSTFILWIESGWNSSSRPKEYSFKYKNKTPENRDDQVSLQKEPQVGPAFWSQNQSTTKSFLEKGNWHSNSNDGVECQEN